MSTGARAFFEKVAALGRDRQAFAVATVVARRPPVSAHLGDRALVFADGRMEGFVGGACSREIIRKQALESIRVRHARLVSIRPDATEASSSDPEHVIVPMTCVSEGAIDVYVEPFVQTRRLVVVGATPVAEALARTGVSLELDVVRVADARDERDLEAPGVSVVPLESLAETIRTGGGGVAAVVASQGHYDEEALGVILGCDASDIAYVGLVASRKRGETVRAFLRNSGIANTDSIRNPAGLDLGARTPPEVALSILAEIVQLATRDSQLATRDPQLAARDPQLATEDSGVNKDPVCGMDVELATARHSAEVDGTTYYFCCANCRTRFVNNPSQFLST